MAGLEPHLVLDREPFHRLIRCTQGLPFYQRSKNLADMSIIIPLTRIADHRLCLLPHWAILELRCFFPGLCFLQPLVSCDLIYQ